MKVLENYQVPFESLPDFLSDHIGESLNINKLDETEASISIQQEYTIPEIHMFHLRKLIESDILTPEEKTSAEYAISAIKTLVDMGVLNND